MVYSIILPGVPLWIRNGTLSGWEPRHGVVPGKEWAVPCVCRSFGAGEGCGLHVESPAISWVVSTGRAGG